jgi:hypothetical protein
MQKDFGAGIAFNASEDLAIRTRTMGKACTMSRLFRVRCEYILNFRKSIIVQEGQFPYRFTKGC